MTKAHSHHAHGHHHSHGTPSYTKAFLIAIVANALFVGVQFIAGFVAHSTSLIADAVHNLGDVFSLILAAVADHMLKKKATPTSSYGMKKISILAALINGLLLVFTSGMIVMEALSGLMHPKPIATGLVMVVATIGIVVNAGTALFFSREQKDLNIRAAFIHLAYDALISLAVVVGALFMYWTDFLWIDKVLGLLIAGVILRGTWGLFKDSFRMLMDFVPAEISFKAVYDELVAIAGVQEVHDLHIWALSTRENALSVHLCMPDEPLTDADRHAIERKLKDQHNIHHVTIQVEKQATYCVDNC